MKAAVIYFSISGNTKKVAEALHGGFIEEGVQSKLISVTHYDNQNDSKYISEADIIGIGSPVHGFRLPVNIPPFVLGNIPDISGKHVFLFCTYGGSPAITVEELGDLVHKKGADVIGALYMPGYNPILTIMSQEIVKEDNIRRPTADELNLIKKFTHFLIFKIEKGIKAPHWDVSERIKNRSIMVSLLVYIFSRKFFLQLLIPPLIFNHKCNPEKCEHQCINACPLNGIMLKPKPSFRGNCLKCLQCLQSCPFGGISIQHPLISRIIANIFHDAEISFSLESTVKQSHFYL